MYLLDTNSLSQILKGDPALDAWLDAKDDAALATCVVVRGELVYMAENSDRRAENLQDTEALLAGLTIHDIDEATADAYGQIKAAIFRCFGPKEKAKRRQTEWKTLGVDENDVWIAAVAKQRGLTVVSVDSDFQRIHQATGLPVENWLSPPTGQPTDES
ncbi:MAG TPA: type II toxin-antitoxin system VapC family toxin [Armatimonadota bacterium]|nr:type II toxin-antitoxin system VapC family toxin [Armatimonadota bacterium]HQK92233.1 type II toxin-antitoxin system VapC family toxin [Armatimonadota bacterium]